VISGPTNTDKNHTRLMNSYTLDGEYRDTPVLLYAVVDAFAPLLEQVVLVPLHVRLPPHAVPVPACLGAVNEPVTPDVVPVGDDLVAFA